MSLAPAFDCSTPRSDDSPKPTIVVACFSRFGFGRCVRGMRLRGQCCSSLKILVFDAGSAGCG